MSVLRNGLIVLLAVAVVAMTAPAYASLVPTSFGFPVIVQNGTTTAFNQDTAAATDLESTDINFPTADEGVLPFRRCEPRFPVDHAECSADPGSHAH